MLKTTNLKAFLSNFQLAIILALVLILPFLVDRNLILIYEVPKIIVFRILIDILIILQVVINFQNTKLRVNAAMLFILISFILTNVISLFYSLDYSTAIWGNENKFFGLFTVAHLIIFVHLVSSIVRGNSTKFVHWFLKLIPFSIVLHFIICTGQLLFGTLNLELTDGRVVGTFGQPNFLAQYALMLLPFQVYSGFKSSGSKFRLFNFVTIALSVLLIIWSGSRLALILFVIQFLALGILLIKNFHTQNIRKSFFYLSVVLVFISGTLFLSGTTINRFKEFGFVDPLRISIWQMALEKVDERPLFGWGYDQQQALFSAIQTNYGIDQKLVIDRSHNEYLDILLNGGIMAFIVLLCTNVFVLTHFIKSNLDSNLKLTVIASYLTFLIQSFFDVNGIIGFVFYFFLLGFMLSELEPNLELKDQKHLEKIVLLIIIGASFLMLALNYNEYNQMLRVT